MLHFQRGMHALVTWDYVHPVGDGRATRCAFVFLEGDGLVRKLVDSEGPKQAGDREEQNTLGDIDTGTNAPTVVQR